MKIRPMDATLFHTDGRTDTTKLIVALRNFANAPDKALQNRSAQQQFLIGTQKK